LKLGGIGLPHVHFPPMDNSQRRIPVARILMAKTIRSQHRLGAIRSERHERIRLKQHRMR